MEKSDSFDERTTATSEQEKNISEQRIIALRESCRHLRIFLTPENFGLIRAIVVYGSTARKTARQESDVDIWVVTEPGKPLTAAPVRTITNLFQKTLPGVEFSIGTSDLQPGSKASQLIVKRGYKHADEKSSWEFIYSAGTQIQSEIDNILTQTQATEE